MTPTVASDSLLRNRAPVLGPRSQSEFERSKVITPGGSMRTAPFFAPHPPYAASGAGCWITDVDGRKVFDCANNFFSLIHGHAFEPVTRAVHGVLDAGTAFGLPTPSETELAEEIRKRSPRLEQIRFVMSGTEAVMFMIKAARAITGRFAIAKFEGAYHGAYDEAEVSLDSSPENWGEADPRSIVYGKGTPPSVADDVVVLPFNDPSACRRILHAHRHRLAAVLVDPTPARVAMMPATSELRDVLQECCRRFGILLLLDEVVSFRLDYGGAHTLLGFEPDLIALAKIIGGGLPIGAVAGPASRMAIFDHTKGKPPVAHGGTFSANPLSMTAGLAALRAYDARAVRRLNELGAKLRESLNEGFKRINVPAQATGAASLFRLHLKRSEISDYRSSFPSPNQRRAISEIHLVALEHGYLLTPNCSGALSTPMTEPDIQGLAAAIIESVTEVHDRSPWS